ncbi:futalosine hydrolase [soil metagenome]
MCGIGPVEAAAATARAIALDHPDLVLHIGVAGGRRIVPGSIVIGTEAVYCDLSAQIPVVSSVEPDAALVELVQRALPEAIGVAIGTSAVVDGPCGVQPNIRVEGMEGFAVLRACELAGVPAVEIRAISNQMGEGDRESWQIRRGLEALADVIPRLMDAVARSRSA